jgi:hypothetical protein
MQFPYLIEIQVLFWHFKQFIANMDSILIATIGIMTHGLEGSELFGPIAQEGPKPGGQLGGGVHNEAEIHVCPGLPQGLAASSCALCCLVWRSISSQTSRDTCRMVSARPSGVPPRVMTPSR